MKELSIEEKAKAYDKALKQIKECTPDENGFVTIYPNEIFPALKESEDEKIRNFLIDFIKACGWTEKKDQGWPLREECIAWLEKQSEQPTEWHREDEQNLNACLGYILDEFLRRWLIDAIHAKYDRHSWSEEDENRFPVEKT